MNQITPAAQIEEGKKAVSDEKPTGLALLREPFPANLISMKPKPTRKQTDDLKNNYKLGMSCKKCGGWHHKDVIHLPYVGHAALTDRLLDCDPKWNWKPLAFADDGTPRRDANGGMWIELTVCGVTRLGYGDAEGKSGGNAVKEVIGDALRNAAMRFGAALDLWHKGDLHPEEATASEGEPEGKPDRPEPEQKQPNWERLASKMIDALKDPANDYRKVIESPKFKANLQEMQAAAPEIAGRVQTEINNTRQLDGDQIPF